MKVADFINWALKSKMTFYVGGPNKKKSKGKSLAWWSQHREAAIQAQIDLGVLPELESTKAKKGKFADRVFTMSADRLMQRCTKMLEAFNEEEELTWEKIGRVNKQYEKVMNVRKYLEDGKKENSKEVRDAIVELMGDASEGEDSPFIRVEPILVSQGFGESLEIIKVAHESSEHVELQVFSGEAAVALRTLCAITGQTTKQFYEEALENAIEELGAGPAVALAVIASKKKKE